MIRRLASIVGVPVLVVLLGAWTLADDVGNDADTEDPGEMTASSSFWVVVNADGTPVRWSSRGISARRVDAGDYEVKFPTDISYGAYVGTQGRHDATAEPLFGFIKVRSTDDPQVVRVTTTDRHGKEVDRGFHLHVAYLPGEASAKQVAEDEERSIIPRVYTVGLERLHGSYAIGDHVLSAQIGHAVYCEMDGTHQHGHYHRLRFVRNAQVSGADGWVYEERENHPHYEYFFAKDKNATHAMARRPLGSGSHWELFEAEVCDRVHR